MLEEMVVELNQSRAERRKARTVGAIQEAAKEKFLARGYHGVTVEEIAAAADVSVGSIYVHFGNKEGLYVALLEEAISLEESYVAPSFDASLPLASLAEAYLRFYLDHPGCFRMLNFPAFVYSPGDGNSAAAVALAERAQQQIDRLAGVIQRRVDLGVLRPMDAHRMAEFFWGAFTGVISLNMRTDRLRLATEELFAVLAEGQRLLSEGIISEAMRNPDGSPSLERILALEAAPAAPTPVAVAVEATA